MIFKCTTCDQPMTPSTKKKPKNVPVENQWILCRQCNNGIEVIGANKGGATAPAPVGKAKAVDTIEFEETTTVYVVIQKTPNGVIKHTYADAEHTKQLSEDQLS